MQNLWQKSDAAQYTDDLSLRVYSSQLLGQNKDLVLHGGGNTSVKITQTNIFGEQEDVLYVKGSGWDLETIEAAGYAPVQIPHLLKLAKLSAMTDSQMVNELKTHMLNANAPTPSVETILHALLPYKYVDHTHADTIISITNTPTGRLRIEEIYGDSVVIIPYIMPGFDLSLLCAKLFPAGKTSKTIGMVLLNHGIFSFGDTAKESYDRMIELVEKAEHYLQSQNAWDIPLTKSEANSSSDTGSDNSNLPSMAIAQLRQKISIKLNHAVIVKNYQSAEINNFCRHSDLERISQQGPATPDHVIRTKQLPMLIDLTKQNMDQLIENYSSNYQIYFKQYSHQSLTILDQLPRVILDPKNGLFSVGKSVKEANIVADIYQHSMKIIHQSESLDCYQALPNKDIFDVEYWELEQAKLKKASAGASSADEFKGEVAIVTGAASGIGKACVDSLIQRGAAVVGLDIDTAINDLYSKTANSDNFLGIQCDLTKPQTISDALHQTIKTFGGLDMLILNAGIFPTGCKVKDLSLAHWQQVMSINLEANVSILSQSHAYLSLAPNGGRVAVIGSKNVPAPGPGAAAYSASKAALNQLVRVTAMEWGKDNIRINSVHPNAVFDTAIWNDKILQSRAKHYGLSVKEYKTNNILKTSITSHDVAELTISLCSQLFSKTTAAQIPIDGGNERVI